MDKEYAICFEGNNGLEEIGISRIKSEAIKQAIWYIRKGAKNMVLNLYEEGDIKHKWDWDYQSKKWKQYE